MPSALQAQAWRQRLADSGGAIGIRIQLFHELYMECLGHVGQPYTELSEPVQYRLLQALINNLPLHHYQSLLQNSPGFIHLLQNLLGELKAARVDPLAFTAAVQDMGNEA